MWRIFWLSRPNFGVVSISCLVAREIDAPAGVTPIEWRLLTNRDVPDLAEAAQLIDWYRARWEVETIFHVLKNGCRVEALQLSTIERIERALAVFMVVAWRIARLMRLGRTCPDLDAGLLFESDEWKAAFILNKKTPGVRLVVVLFDSYRHGPGAVESA
jgi:hypothetical protein